MHLDPEPLPVGMQLRVERITAKLSVTEVAAAVEISIGHLSRIETGERSVSDEQVTQIRAAIAELKASKAAVA